MNPTPITNLFSGTPVQAAGGQLNNSSGLSGSSSFENALLNTNVDVGEEVITSDQGLLGEFKELFSLLSLFWDSTPTQVNALDGENSETTLNDIQGPSYNQTKNLDPLKEQNNSRAFDGFISDLQIILSIIQSLLSNITNSNETTSTLTNNSEIIQNAEETSKLDIESSNNIQVTPSTTSNEEITKIAETADTDNIIDNSQGISDKSDTNTDSQEQIESNINISNNLKAEENDNSIREKKEQDINLLEQQHTQFIKNKTTTNNNNFIRLKEFDITFTTFELHNNANSIDLTDQLITTNNQISNNNQSNIDLTSLKRESDKAILQDLYGNKTKFSALDSNGNKIEGEITQFFGSINQSRNSSNEFNKKEINFELKSLHIASSYDKNNIEEPKLDTILTTNKDDILVIDYNKNSDIDQNNLSITSDIKKDSDTTLITNQTSQLTNSQLASNEQLNNTSEAERTVLSQVTDGLNQLVKLNKTRAVLHLNPPELGSVKVNITIDHNHHVQANFIADHPETKQILEANLQHLREHLSQNGFSLAQVNIDLGGNFDNTGGWLQDNGGANSQQQFVSENPSLSPENTANTPPVTSDDNSLHIVV